MSRRPKQSGLCLKCGTWRSSLHRDHIEPSWRGGLDCAENYQWLCANCHEDKTYAERATKEYKTFVGAQVSARMLSPEARQRISDGVRKANKRRSWTPEQRQKCGRPGVKRAPFSPEHLANMKIAQQRRRMLEQPKEKA